MGEEEDDIAKGKCLGRGEMGTDENAYDGLDRKRRNHAVARAWQRVRVVESCIIECVFSLFSVVVLVEIENVRPRFAKNDVYVYEETVYCIG